MGDKVCLIKLSETSRIVFPSVFCAPYEIYLLLDSFLPIFSIMFGFKIRCFGPFTWIVLAMHWYSLTHESDASCNQNVYRVLMFDCTQKILCIY